MPAHAAEEAVDGEGAVHLDQAPRDIISFGRGRTELTLSTTMPLASVSALYPNEIVWAKTLVGRVRA